jgi:hypothetical protein
MRVSTAPRPETECYQRTASLTPLTNFGFGFMGCKGDLHCTQARRVAAFMTKTFELNYFESLVPTEAGPMRAKGCHTAGLAKRPTAVHTWRVCAVLIWRDVSGPCLDKWCKIKAAEGSKCWALVCKTIQRVNKLGSPMTHMSAHKAHPQGVRLRTVV